MCGFRRRLLRGSWLQLVVLKILYEQPLHGYRLLQEVNALMTGRKKLKPGSLYTILRRMEHAGLLASVWEKRGARLDRRVYHLTEHGIEALRQGKRVVEGQQKVLEEMAAFYRQHFPDDDDA